MLSIHCGWRSIFQVRGFTLPQPRHIAASLKELRGAVFRWVGFQQDWFVPGIGFQISDANRKTAKMWRRWLPKEFAGFQPQNTHGFLLWKSHCCDALRWHQDEGCPLQDPPNSCLGMARARLRWHAPLCCFDWWFESAVASSQLARAL